MRGVVGKSGLCSSTVTIRFVAPPGQAGECKMEVSSQFQDAGKLSRDLVANPELPIQSLASRAKNKKFQRACRSQHVFENDRRKSGQSQASSESIPVPGQSADKRSRHVSRIVLSGPPGLQPKERSLSRGSNSMSEFFERNSRLRILLVVPPTLLQ